MIKKLRIIPIATLLTLPFFIRSSNLLAIGVEAALGLAQISPKGQLGYKSDGLDLKNDLNYGKVLSYNARVKLDLPLFLPNIYFLATPLRFEEIGSKTIGFQFGDNAFTSNQSYTTKLQLDHYDTALYYGIPLLETATIDKLNIEFGINTRLLDFSAAIDQPASGLAQSKRQLLPVPMGLVMLQFRPVKKINVEAEFRGIQILNNHYYDAIGRLKYRILKVLFVDVGYKYQSIIIDQSDIKANLQFGGPTFELGAEF